MVWAHFEGGPCRNVRAVVPDPPPPAVDPPCIFEDEAPDGEYRLDGSWTQVESDGDGNVTTTAQGPVYVWHALDD